MDESVVYFEIWNSKGKRVASVGDFDKLPAELQQRPRENFVSGRYRNAFRESDNGAVRLLFHRNNAELQGSKSISRACAIYLSLVPKFEKIAQAERQHSDALLKRFAHNLTHLQRRTKDTMNELVSDKARARPYKEFKEEVEKRIVANTSHAADVLCQMSHRTVDLDAQIETLRIISGFADESAPSVPLLTDLRRAMFRLTNPFVDELRRNKVELELRITQATSDKSKVLLTHSLFGAAVWQLLDNAVKYVLPGSTIVISALPDSRPQKLTIEMTSVRIDDDEYVKIFSERYTGRHAKNKAGSGIGMFIVSKALSLMGATIAVARLQDHGELDGVPYARHEFAIAFRG